MKATIPIGLQPNTKLLRIERVSRMIDTGQKHSILNRNIQYQEDSWLIWIYHNPDFTLGTYLTLHDDGRVTNTTVKEDGTEEVFQVKGPD